MGGGGRDFSPAVACGQGVPVSRGGAGTLEMPLFAAAD